MDVKEKQAKPECNYMNGRYGDGFETNGTDYKTLEICLGEKDSNEDEDLVGWLRLRIAFGHYFDLKISNSGEDLFQIYEGNLGVLVGLRDFLNYAIKDEQ
tara:strand:- start:160 stop:459 length:300 start_codon:yes stop_codon:yes gene_type:complete